MLRTAAGLFREHGYHGTGLNQVLAEGGHPRGSLYFHFPGGKDELAAEAVRWAAAELTDAVAAALACADDLASGVDAALGLLAAQLVESDFRLGCPIGTVAPEGGEPVRLACVEAFGRWQEVVRDFAARHGVRDADAVATTVIAAVEGGLLLARTHRDTAPLDAVAATLRTMVRGLETTCE